MLHHDAVDCEAEAALARLDGHEIARYCEYTADPERAWWWGGVVEIFDAAAPLHFGPLVVEAEIVEVEHCGVAQRLFVGARRIVRGRAGPELTGRRGLGDQRRGGRRGRWVIVDDEIAAIDPHAPRTSST